MDHVVADQAYATGRSLDAGHPLGADIGEVAQKGNQGEVRAGEVGVVAFDGEDVLAFLESGEGIF